MTYYIKIKKSLSDLNFEWLYFTFKCISADGLKIVKKYKKKVRKIGVLVC